MSLILSGTDGLSDIDGSAATPAIRGADANTGIFFPAADTIAFAEGGVESMRVDSSGNVGIGTTTPSNRVSIVTASGSDGIVSVKSPLTDTAGVVIDGGTSSNKGSVLKFSKNASVLWQMGTDSAIIGATSDNFHLYGGGANAILFSTNAAQRYVIGSAGQLGIGASPSYGSSGQVLTSGGSGAAPTWSTPSAGAVSFVSAVTASAASTVSFTGLTSTPAYYFIEFDGLISSTNDGLECYLSINNGSSYISSGYRYTFIFSEAATSSTVSSTGSTVGVKIILADSPPSSNANYPSKGIVRILGAGAPRASIQSEITIITATANVNHNVGAAMPDTASGVNAIKFQGASGTITGNFRLYSVSKT